jgi:pimeloyl-ACP methyl ester carboxylesterase
VHIWIPGRELRLHARELRAGCEPALLLLHGYGESHVAWNDAVEAMRTSQRTLALDLRGHGDSGWSPTGDYSLPATVDDIRRTVAALDLDRVVLAGHSVGGMAALAFAVEEPDAVVALALLDVDPFRFKDGLERLLPFAGPHSAASLEELGGRDLSVAGGARERGLRRLRELARVDADGRWTWKQDPRLRPDQPVHPARPRDDTAVAAMLGRLSCPLLLLHGERSRAASRTALDRTARLVAGRITISEIAGAGHALLADAPQAVAAELSDFLAAVVPGST